MHYLLLTLSLKFIDSYDLTSCFWNSVEQKKSHLISNFHGLGDGRNSDCTRAGALNVDQWAKGQELPLQHSQGPRVCRLFAPFH